MFPSPRGRCSVAAVVVAAAVAISAQSATAAPTNKFGTSFVDVDNDGVFDAGSDVLLSSIVGPDDTSFSTGEARPGYTPPPPPVGLVIEGKVTLVDWSDLFASGTLIVRGSLKNVSADPYPFFSLDMYGTTVEIAPRSKITHKGHGTLQILGDRIVIGERSRLTAVNEYWLGSEGEMVFGDNVQIRSTGRKYDFSPYCFIGALDLQAGEGLYVRGNDYSQWDIEHNGEVNTDMLLREFRFRGGSLGLLSYDHPDGNRLHVLDSMIDQRDVDGGIQLYADPGPNGFLPDALLLTGTSMRVRGSLHTTPPLP
jgi:hypothetical protein